MSIRKRSVGGSLQWHVFDSLLWPGGHFEGDIFLTSDAFTRGIGRRDPSARWPSGIVPYEISPVFGKKNRCSGSIGFYRSPQQMVSIEQRL